MYNTPKLVIISTPRLIAKSEGWTRTSTPDDVLCHLLGNTGYTSAETEGPDHAGIWQDFEYEVQVECPSLTRSFLFSSTLLQAATGQSSAIIPPFSSCASSVRSTVSFHFCSLATGAPSCFTKATS